MPKFVLIILFVFITLQCFSGEVFPVPQLPFQPLVYLCQKSHNPIVIDGKLDDKDWKPQPTKGESAWWTDNFVDIEGALKPTPAKQTHVKMLWDEKGLYIGAELYDDHIWANVKERDAVVFYDNDFEIFIDPDGDTHDYYELEINALGTLWDLFITAPYYRVKDWPALYSWDARHIQYAIGIDGTINDPSDTDKKWTLEMLIPWSDIKDQAHMDCPPKRSDFWRMNFSRVEWQTDVVDGKYVKKEGVPESNWVWSPQGLIAMHYPERWGVVYFDDSLGAIMDAEIWPPPIPEIEYAKNYLYSLYYKQKQYWFDHGVYAKTLEELQAKPFPYKWKDYNQSLIPMPQIKTTILIPSIETTSQSFIITLPVGEGVADLHINETGLTW